MPGLYVIKRQFTTEDGELYPSDKQWSINKEDAEWLSHEQVEGDGCATCFFVKLEGGPGDTVHYVTTAGLVEDHPVDRFRWAHISMFNPGSGYNPTNNIGPWTAMAKDAPSEAVSGVGLPSGHHVTTFAQLVWEEAAEPTPPDPGPTPPDPGQSPPDSIAVAMKVGNTTYQGTLQKV